MSCGSAVRGEKQGPGAGQGLGAKGLEPAGDEREEIAGLRERILPAGLVAAVVKVLLLNAVAVGE